MPNDALKHHKCLEGALVTYFCNYSAQKTANQPKIGHRSNYSIRHKDNKDEWDEFIVGHLIRMMLAVWGWWSYTQGKGLFDYVIHS